MRLRDDWARMVDLEGGLAEMAVYGGEEIIKQYDLPDDIKAAWVAFCRQLEALRALLERDGAVI